MDKEIELIISRIKEFLESKSAIFDEKILPALEFMHNRNESVKANNINFWRQPDQKNLRLEISLLANNEEEVYQTELNSGLITNWNTVFSENDLMRFYDKHGDSIQLEIRIEKEFISWFIQNWYRIGGHKIENTKQVIIENSSALGFDLNSMNYDEAVDGEHKLNYHYSHILTEHEISQRLNIYEVIGNFRKEHIRILKNSENLVEIKYDNGKLSHTNLPNEFEDLIASANKERNRYKSIKILTAIVDKLIEQSYEEK